MTNVYMNTAMCNCCDGVIIKDFANSAYHND